MNALTTLGNAITKHTRALFDWPSVLTDARKNRQEGIRARNNRIAQDIQQRKRGFPVRNDSRRNVIPGYLRAGL